MRYVPGSTSSHKHTHRTTTITLAHELSVIKHAWIKYPTKQGVRMCCVNCTLDEVCLHGVSYTVYAKLGVHVWYTKESVQIKVYTQHSVATRHTIIALPSTLLLVRIAL